MIYFNHAILLFAAAVTAQDYNTGQYSDQVASASAVISQDRQDMQATISSYAQAHGYTTQVPESVKEHVSEHHEKHKDKKEAQKASASAYFANQGYTTVPPADVRQSYVSSMMVARSTQASDVRNSVSAFMATQTKINTASLAEAISSYSATATTKSQWKDRFKMNKKTRTRTNVSDIQATSAATTTGLSKGFKNFFKSLQLKIQKTSTVAAATTAS